MKKEQTTRLIHLIQFASLTETELLQATGGSSRPRNEAINLFGKKK